MLEKCNRSPLLSAAKGQLKCSYFKDLYIRGLQRKASGLSCEVVISVITSPAASIGISV